MQIRYHEFINILANSIKYPYKALDMFLKIFNQIYGSIYNYESLSGYQLLIFFS